MKITPTSLPEVLLIEPDIYRDERGFFLETYHAEKYKAAGITTPFVQTNFSGSVKGVIRGLHMQVKRPQGKLVQVVHGEIFDVAVDARRGSPRFGQWTSVVLKGGTFVQCWIPPGFLHGFAVLSDTAHVQYLCTELYSASDEVGVKWNDPKLEIGWPIARPVLSKRDRTSLLLTSITDRLPHYQGVR